jgi:hypothetical protein
VIDEPSGAAALLAEVFDLKYIACQSCMFRDCWFPEGRGGPKNCLAFVVIETLQKMEAEYLEKKGPNPTKPEGGGLLIRRPFKEWK